VTSDFLKAQLGPWVSTRSYYALGTKFNGFYQILVTKRSLEFDMNQQHGIAVA
jgi:hypothetical protein